MTVLFDSDAYDREILASRLRADDFTVTDICEHFNVGRGLLLKRMQRHTFPVPTKDIYGHCHWTRLQVAQMQAEGLLAQPRWTRKDMVRPPCGTYNGWAYHWRHQEKPCDACLHASREYKRAQKHKQRGARQA